MGTLRSSRILDRYISGRTRLSRFWFLLLLLLLLLLTRTTVDTPPHCAHRYMAGVATGVAGSGSRCCCQSSPLQFSASTDASPANCSTPLPLALRDHSMVPLHRHFRHRLITVPRLHLNSRDSSSNSYRGCPSDGAPLRGTTQTEHTGIELSAPPPYCCPARLCTAAVCYLFRPPLVPASSPTQVPTFYLNFLHSRR